jgi:hypothetical protein
VKRLAPALAKQNGGRAKPARLFCGAASVALVALAGCGGSPSTFTLQPARVYSLGEFRPAAPVEPGKPATFSFDVMQPDGTPLTKFKHGPGPHTGIHLILVRDDLAYIVHLHPPVGAGGKIATGVTLPAPGPYRVVVDVYPAIGPNFQLFGRARASGAYRPQALPPTRATDVVGACRFTLSGASHLKAIEAEDVTVRVTCGGKPAHFTPWYGALAHAIFFRRGSLDYFHTHVCAPGAVGCTSILGPVKVTGTSTTPGKLAVGVLVPAPGTWRLFLQCRAGGRILTAPFTLHVT